MLMLLLTALNAQQPKAPAVKSVPSNNQCEELRKENENLKKSLNIITTSDENNSIDVGDVNFKLLKIRGDIKSQMITVDVLMTNKIEHRQLGVIKNQLKIVTIEGDVLTHRSTVIGGNGYNSELILNTDVPIKSTFTFGPLLPSNEYLKLFHLDFIIYHATDYKQNISNGIDWKDEKIQWK
jgi:hypothetical protein